VRAVSGHTLDAQTAKAAEVARATPGVAEVRAFTKAESEKLLEPWLGSGVDLSELPVPRMIVLKLDPGRAPDIADLRARLRDAAPDAVLDDHRLWIDRLSAMAQTMVGMALFVLALVFVAMALAVAFATRGAMAGSRHIVEVLHFVGAENRFVAAQFQRMFLRLGLKGGAIGGVCAIALFMVSGALSRFWSFSPGGDQIEALFGSFSLGFRGYAAITGIAVAIAFLTGYMSRLVVFRHLSSLE
jgi:cell division transport system permease protein